MQPGPTAVIKRTWKATGEERVRWKRQRPFCASSELNSYELRGQGRELQRGRSHPLLLPRAQQWLSEANTALPRLLDPASPEQGAEPRLQACSLRCCRSVVAAWIQHGNAAPAAAVLMHGTEKNNLPFQLLHYRGWRPGGRVSLYWLSLGGEKKSCGPQLPRKLEANALSSVTDLSSFHESPYPAINSSPGNPCLPP